MSGQKAASGEYLDAARETVKAAQYSTPDDALITSSPRAKHKGMDVELTDLSGTR